MIRFRFLGFILLFMLKVNPAWSTTEKYRLMWRSDPSTTMVIGWNQVSGTDPVVFYGTVDFGINYSQYPASKTPDRVVPYLSMNNHFARLSGLLPNTTYYFVINDSQGTSQRFSFRTAPADPASRLSIIAGGDSRNNRLQRQNANKLVSKLRPHVVLFGGDFTASNFETEWNDWFNDWQLTIGADGRIVPVVVARGNHESSDEIVVNLFDVPHANVYYGLTFGGNLLRVYTLNTETSIAGNQTTWLTSDLQSNGNIQWKMAQYHKPIRPHVSTKSEGNTAYQYWASLFFQHKVKVVIECDAHTVKSTWPVIPSSGTGSYEGFIRNDAEGTVYLGEGCWGAPLRLNDDDKPWTRNSGMFNQFHWIFVDQQKIEARFVKTDNASQVGTVSDTDIFTPPLNLDIWNPGNGAIITVPAPELPPGVVISSRVNAGTDDAEERESGTTGTTSGDLEMAFDNSTTGNQTVGVRFNNLTIPKGATITNAYVQFTSDEASSDVASLLIQGENTDNAATFATTSFNVSGRPRTVASVSWNPDGWSVKGEGSIAQRTPELKTILQEIASRPGWSPGNSVGLIITGTGKRTASAFNGAPERAPILYVTYTVVTSVTVTSRTSLGADDVEERTDGVVSLASSDLELVYDNAVTGNQTVGIRFQNVQVPRGSIISGAYIQFTADAVGGLATSLFFDGEAADNAAVFKSSAFNVSSRRRTAAGVSWNPISWPVAGEAGNAQKSPELKTLIQEIVNRPGWVSGNALSVIITGTGRRSVKAFESSSTLSPQLFVTYSTDGASGTNGAGIEARLTSVPEYFPLAESITVSPNPLEEKLSINVPAGLSGKFIVWSFFTESGAIAMSSSCKVGTSGIVEVDIRLLSKGFYVLKVSTSEGSKSFKLFRK